jgi:hypothetical protein
VTDFLRPFRDDALPTPAQGPATLSLMRTCFADEIAIDFPSIGPAVDRVRETFVASDDHAAPVETGVALTSRQASIGAIVPIELGLSGLCAGCGGRGESWAEPCGQCAGTGERAHTHHFRLALPPGVADGTRFRFVVSPPSVRATRVEVTVSVA